MAKHVTLAQIDKVWKAAKNLFVVKEEGKGLSTNDFDNDAKAKLAGVAEGAEKNLINSIKVNGVVLTIDETGAVDVPVEKVTVEEASDEDIDAVLNGTFKA